MFKFISKWIEKVKIKKTPQKSQIEYVTLTPDDKIANGAEYLNALKWAIDGKKARNIALSGPYGSGKSSVIETFLKNNPSLEQRSIKISMATFVEEALNDKGAFEKQKIKLEKDEIEKGILKQLFYKVDHRKIPQSRYRKLHRISFWRIFAVITALILACLLVSYVFWPSSLSSAVTKIAVAGATIKLPKWLSLTAAGVFVFGCITAISALYRSILSRFKVKEIKLPKDVSVQNSNENQDTIFNKNMDEIVYFFEETKYNLVFFEDFDRLNNTSIFVHLRELNIILNNYDAIKDPIIFVYAVKDDIFTEVDRTKFFDFIIPIVPIINSTNSGEILLKKLDESKKLQKEHNISESFVMDVSPYISDMRVLQNIYNEFVVYKSTLTTGQGLKLLDEPMLALIIFKNLYPREFAELQMETGIVKQAFKDKERFVSGKRKEIQERIEASTEVLENIHTNSFATRKSLKCAFLCEITNNIGIARDFTPAGKSSVSATSFLRDDYDIPDWSGIDNCRGYYTNWNGNSGYSFNGSNFDTIYEKFIRSYKVVGLIEDNRIEEEKALVETMQRQIYELSSKSLAELIDEYSTNAVLSVDVKSNDLLVFLLRRGYVDEKYVDYINYFKATTITTDDMNYILGIKNLSPKPYNYKLTRTDLVVKRLQPYEFEQEAIYNFDLLECLLSSNEYEEKLNLYIKQLSNGIEASWKFIDEFVDITKHKQRFINILATQWDEMWDSIFENSVLTLDRKFYYLSLLISYASIDSIKAMNTNGNLTTFIVSNGDVLQRLSSVDDAKTINVITSLEIKFIDIQIENVSARVLDYIFDNNFYNVNFEMINRIVEYKDKELVQTLKTKNYSTLLKLDYVPLLNHIKNNIDTYTDEIVLLGTNTEEDIDAIVKLLELNVGSKCRHIQIIGNENFYVEDIASICVNLWQEHKRYVTEIWNTIITNGKLKPSWQNFRSYWHYLGHTDVSINYMCKNIDALTKDDSTCIDDESFIKEFIEFDIDRDSFAKLLPKLPWNNFNLELSTLSEEKISTMISQKYFKFDADRFNELSEEFPALSVEFIIHNQSEYMSIYNQIDMDSTLLETLVFDQRFERANVQQLIDDYGAEYMTTKIARNINVLRITLDINLFDIAWSLLEIREKERLMLEHLDLLDADKLESCFSELGGQYSELSDRSRRHEVSLTDSQNNLKLIHRLDETEYITSFQMKSIKEFDPVKSEDKTINKIICRIKAVN